MRSRVLDQEDINFALTNLIPRRWLTRMVGRLSRIENPLVARASIGLWKMFSDLDLSEARTTSFRSMRDCFTRELKQGARPIDSDPQVLTSPSDGVVAARGRITNGLLIQAKGLKYELAELLGDDDLADRFSGGTFATLRLKSSMYHRFHAPYDCQVNSVTHFHGDTWNVNPPALKRVPRLYCRNERAVVLVRLQPTGHVVALVPIGAILVASIRLHFLDTTLHMKRVGPSFHRVSARLAKGEEMGWFEQGSTIVIVAPRGLELADAVQEGELIRMGQPLMRLTRPVGCVAG
jgi:phosphatidylserine decarboxylase